MRIAVIVFTLFSTLLSAGTIAYVISDVIRERSRARGDAERKPARSEDTSDGES